MKTNKLVIAAAGSGKTTFLVNEALSQREGNVLITTYTQANEAEIRKKFVELNGCVPSHVTIQTWFSTLLQHGIRPYQGGLYDEPIRGMLLVNEPSALRYAQGHVGFTLVKLLTLNSITLQATQKFTQIRFQSWLFDVMKEAMVPLLRD